MMHKAWNNIEEIPYCLSRSSVKFQGHTGQKNHRFWPELSVSGLQLKFEFSDGYEMMHKVWSNIEEVPYCFSRSFVKFQGHTGQKIADCDPNWAFPDCNSSLNSPMDFKWCPKLDVVLKMYQIIFRGHRPNFKVLWAETSTIWIQFEKDYHAGRSYQMPQICLVVGYKQTILKCFW